MKNLAIYYLAILMPFPLMYFTAINGESELFVALLFSYLIYRGFVDGKRLVDKELLSKKESWKAFIPFYTASYIKELYFEK